MPVFYDKSGSFFQTAAEDMSDLYYHKYVVLCAVKGLDYNSFFLLTKPGIFLLSTFLPLPWFPRHNDPITESSSRSYTSRAAALLRRVIIGVQW